MLLVIHNLPSSTKYTDLKALIQSKCGLTDYVLDHLAPESPNSLLKRVTVGLADEGDGAILVRKINGLYVGGQQLYVEDARNKKDSEQPYRSSQQLSSQNSYDNFLNIESGDNMRSVQDLNAVYQNQDPVDMMTMAAMSGMYYMPNTELAQNTYMGYGGQQQKIMPLMAQVPDSLHRPFGYDADTAGENSVDWGSNSNRLSDRSRLQYDHRRAPSPTRERSDMFLDRRQSKWDVSKPEARVENRRRSRSPQRGWNSRDRPDNRQNRFENYREDPELKNKSQGYDRGRNNDRSASNFGAARNNDSSTSNYRGHRNMDLSASNYGAPTNMDISASNFGASRNMDLSASNFGAARNMDLSTSSYGASRNMDLSASNFRASRNMNLSASNFEGLEPFIEQPSNNLFGSHVMQPSASRWNETTYNQDRFEPDRFQPQRGGRDVPKHRGGGNLSPREMSKPFEPRGTRGGPRPSRQFESRRDEPRGPVKRGNSRRDNAEPQAKKFAPPTGPGSQRPPFGKVGPRGPNGPPSGKVGPKGSNGPPFGKAGPKGPNGPPFGKVGPKGPNAPNPRARKPEPAMFAKPNIEPQLSLEKLMNKDETWRGQAASTIAKEMVKTLGVELPLGNRLFSHLKQSIRARINVMLGDKIMDRLQIIEMYASKFPSANDQEFFNSVVNSLKEKETKEKTEALANAAASGTVGSTPPKPAAGKTANAPSAKPPVKQANPAAKSTKPPVTSTKPSATAAKSPAKPAKQVAKKAAKKQPPKAAPLPSGHLLPNFPEGDKISFKKTKAEDKKDWYDENLDLPEDLKKALDAEVDTMCDTFMSECMDQANEQEKPVCDEIADIVSDDFRRVVRVHVAKRLMNDTKSLVVRVHSAYRMPKRQALEEFLLAYGCTALQKSDRQGQLYMAHFDNFDNADKLIELGTAEIEGIPMSFKAFQVCGPPPSAKEISLQHKDKMKKFHQSQIDHSKENILQPGYVYNPSSKKDGDVTTDTTNNDNQNINGSVPNEEEDQTNEEAEIEAGENYDDGDDAGEFPEEAGDFPDEADDIPEDNVDEDDLEDY